MSLVILPTTLTGGTTAKASDVMGDLQALATVVNGQLDQTNFQTLYGALSWAITSNSNALSINDAGNIETISITKTAGVVAGHSVVLISVTGAQTLGNAGLEVDFTSASSTISVLRTTNSGTGHSIDVSASGVLASGKRLVSIVSTAAQTAGDAGLYVSLSNAGSTIPSALLSNAGSGATISASNTGTGNTFTGTNSGTGVVISATQSNSSATNGVASFSNAGTSDGVVITDTGTPSAGGAALKIVSTTKGFLPPSMTTTQRNAIPSPVEGTYVYNNALHRPEVYDGLAWAGTGSRIAVKAVTTAYTVATSDDLVLANATSAGFNVTMPAVSSSVAGKVFTVQKTDSSSNTVNVKDSIGNVLVAMSAQYNFADLVTDGTNWYIIRQSITSNYNLPGKAVQESSKNLVVSNTNATNSLAMVRGRIDQSANILTGEGFSASHVGTGHYSVSFSTNFGDVPACLVTVETGGSNLVAITQSVATSGFNIFIDNGTGGLVDSGFDFIAIGQRA